MSLNINGRMKVKTLKDQFKADFGLSLRLYDGRSFANEDSTLASIRKEGDINIAGEFSPRRNMLVGNFEEKMMETFGIKCQISGSDDSYLCDNDLTLAAAQEKDQAKLERASSRKDSVSKIEEDSSENQDETIDECEVSEDELADIAYDSDIEINCSSDIEKLFRQKRIQDILYSIHGYFSNKLYMKLGWHEDFTRDHIYSFVGLTPELWEVEWEGGCDYNDEGRMIVADADNVIAYIAYSDMVSEERAAEFFYYYLALLKMNECESSQFIEYNEFLIKNKKEKPKLPAGLNNDPKGYLLSLALSVCEEEPN